MKVTTAVIFASGFGSRMLPVTAAVQKDLLPILDRPCIDYIIADCLEAGIRDFIITIRPGSHDMQDYYVGNPVLESHLRRYGKKEALAKLHTIHKQATFNFVEQPADAGYGTAVPLMVAIPHLPKDSAVLVSSGDEVIWRTDGGSNMRDLVSVFEDSGAEGAITGLEQPEDQLYKYGVLEVARDGDHEFLRGFVEKPELGQAPSNVANTSKYILTPDLLKYVLNVKPDAKSNEFYVTDAVRNAAAEHNVVVSRAKGEWLDCGSVKGWLHANLTVAKSRPELGLV
ncbi:MAG TPA: sugar phosphate nucleotidyltransferase [Candidatus Saccharimonadia bacterium]|nr:sugar phosphate nucleotidyltransferase [Candidatus Saccharimonadia bacterium]